jgi:thioredoxin-related protein
LALGLTTYCMIKTLSLFLLSTFFITVSEWGTDFEKAKQTAVTEHKYILLNFSGSDWCGPCIRLHKEIFDSDAFKKMADSMLVLVNADFPRQKKNQLPKELQKNNDKLADKFNATGIFPLTVLLTADGKLIKKWEGYPSNGAEDFIGQIKQAANVAK